MIANPVNDNYSASDRGFATSVDGVKIYYEVFGKGSTTLVFVHGGWCNRTHWENQVNHFRKNFKVVVLDLGGHGKSGQNRNVWSVEKAGDDVVCVIEKLELENVILVGHSLGGSAILEAALKTKRDVKALIAVDRFHEIENRFAKEDIDKALKPLKENCVQTMDNFVRQGLLLPTTDSTLADKIANDMTSVPPQIGIGLVSDLLAYDKTISQFEKLKIPVRFINSSMTPTNIESANRYIKDLKIEIMENVGHFVMLEDPESFNRILNDVLSEIIK